MKLTKHLDQICDLVHERADPAKIKSHVELIRDQVEAAEKVETKFRKQLSILKKAHAQELADTKAKINKLEAENKNLVKKIKVQDAEIFALSRRRQF